MPYNEDMAQRLRMALRRIGYWKGDRPDVGRFCREKGYLPQSVYSWLQGVEPRHEALRSLAAHLQCSVAWLVAGEEAGTQVREAVANLTPGPGRLLRGGAAARRGAGETTLQVFDAGPIRRLREVTARLEQMEAALQAFFDIYPDLLMWLDQDGTISSASHGRDFELLMPIEKQIGKKIWDVLPAAFGRKWKETIAHVRSTRHPSKFEEQIPVKGKPRNWECRLVPIKGHGFLAMVRDVTELRELQERARARKPRES